MKFNIRILALAVAALLCASATAQTRSPKADVARNLDVFNTIYKVLQTTYVDSIDAKKSINTAIYAMLDEIDPYTQYIPEEETEEFFTISTGVFGGIGAYIGQNAKGETYVEEPQAGTPAMEAGLRAGDVFLTIDGDTVTSIGSAKVRERLRGQAGTPLTVTVRRPYVADSILTIHLTRAKIDVPTVPYYGVLADSVGYIQLNTFNEKSGQLVRDAVAELRRDPRVQGIILDLSGNGGGLLESAVDVLSVFLPKGTEVLRTRGRDAEQERIYKTSAAPVDVQIPLAVLIDGASASSAEITAGALQDLDRAVIVGTRSYGKGLVQSTRPLPGNGYLKLTTARYYIPSGRLIQAIDYSRRNPDGSVARIPDSLTSVFYTRAGRPVRDGGGITPDDTISYPQPNRLVYNIVTGRWAFDFATKYAAEHPTIAPPETFEIDDEIFGEFKQSIDPDRLQYDKVCETIMARLEDAAKTEGYLTDSVAAQLELLKPMLKHDLGKDLDTHRDLISQYLTAEIVKRYYNGRGVIIAGLRTDPAVQRAKAILTDPEKYRSFLAAPDKK